MRVLRWAVGLTLSVCLLAGCSQQAAATDDLIHALSESHSATSSTGRPARLYGIVVSPHARSSSLGYERSGVRSPWPIAALVRWRHRGSFLVQWEDLERLDVRRINLRSGFTKVSSQLP